MDNCCNQSTLQKCARQACRLLKATTVLHLSLLSRPKMPALHAQCNITPFACVYACIRLCLCVCSCVRELQGDRVLQQPVKMKPIREKVARIIWMLHIMLQAAARNIQNAEERERIKVISQLAPAHHNMLHWHWSSAMDAAACWLCLSAQGERVKVMVHLPSLYPCEAAQSARTSALPYKPGCTTAFAS